MKNLNFSEAMKKLISFPGNYYIEFHYYTKFDIKILEILYKKSFVENNI